jgi:protein-tyrosine-phosphatase
METLLLRRGHSRKEPDPVKTFIFACVHNAGRSQMSAAFFNQLADPELARAISAGTHPAAQVHPVVIDVMREVGIDLSNATPQKLTEELAKNAEMLITMGCGDECPFIPGLKRADWPLSDPKGKDVSAVREIRDEIRGRVESLVTSENVPHKASKFVLTAYPPRRHR